MHITTGQLIERIRTARINAGMTQQALADACGLSQAVIGRLERGDPPKDQTLADIAAALGFQASRLDRWNLTRKAGA